MNMIFNELDFRLSEISRWGIIHTIRKQSVAEHQFNVEKIARGIAQEWFRVACVDDLDCISQMALRHDELEALTGDVPSIVKDCIDETKLGHRYVDMFRPWYNKHDVDKFKHIVKIADKIDALFFLYMEKSLGNCTVNSIITQIEGILYDLLEPYGYAMWKNWEDLSQDVFPHGQYQVDHHDRRPKPDTSKGVPVDEEIPS